MSNSSDHDEGASSGPVEAPPLPHAGRVSPSAGAPETTPNEQAPDESPVRHRTLHGSETKRGGGVRRPARASSNSDAVASVAARGGADAIVVPMLGSLLGLMAIGAVGLILISRRKSRASSTFAALSRMQGQWLHGAAAAEHRLATDLSGRVSRIRRQYDI
jgi:hypothetical protein